MNSVIYYKRQFQLIIIPLVFFLTLQSVEARCLYLFEYLFCTPKKTTTTKSYIRTKNTSRWYSHVCYTLDSPRVSVAYVYTNLYICCFALYFVIVVNKYLYVRADVALSKPIECEVTFVLSQSFNSVRPCHMVLKQNAFEIEIYLFFVTVLVTLEC